MNQTFKTILPATKLEKIAAYAPSRATLLPTIIHIHPYPTIPSSPPLLRPGRGKMHYLVLFTGFFYFYVFNELENKHTVKACNENQQ